MRTVDIPIPVPTGGFVPSRQVKRELSFGVHEIQGGELRWSNRTAHSISVVDTIQPPRFSRSAVQATAFSTIRVARVGGGW